MAPIIAIAAGAAAMYFFDPEQGARRRALVRGKFAWMKDEYGDVFQAAEGKAEDLKNRTVGLLHETGIRPVPHDQPKDASPEASHDTDHEAKRAA